MSTDKKIPIFKSKKSPDGASTKSIKNLVLILGSLLAVAIMLSWALGRLSSSQANPDEVFAVVFTGSGQSRRAAVAEWAYQLQNAELASSEESLKEWSPHGSIVARLINLLKTAEANEDPLYLASVVTVLSFSSDEKDRIRALLLESLADDRNFRDAQFGVYSLLALARIGFDPKLNRSLWQRYAETQDDALRKSLAFALGSGISFERSSEKEVRQVPPILFQLLRDPVSDVRWNAAFSLAKYGEKEAMLVLNEILSKAEAMMSSEGGIVLTAELFVPISQSLFWVLKLDPESSLRRVEKIASDHPNLKLRQKAFEALEDFKKSPSINL